MNVNRRTVVRNSVWAAPAVGLLAAAPAVAASPQTLSFSFSVQTSFLATGPAGNCSDLTITINNSASTIPLTLTKVETLLFGGAVNTQTNQSIPAGQTVVTTASSQGQAVPAGFSLSWRITYLDAKGVEQVVTTPAMTTGTCGNSTTTGLVTSTNP